MLFRSVPRAAEHCIILDDGTRIHLNAETTLTIPTDFSPENRNICLTGEAYLDVAKDSIHPFTIKTQYADVIVLGTRLNISSYTDDNDIKVVLEQGRVEIRSAKDYAKLPVGMMARISETGNIGVEKVIVDHYTAWHNNRIVFENEPLVDIVHKLGRWYDFKASFSNDELRNMTFTMDVNKYVPFNSLIQIMQQMDELEIDIKRNEILISEK